MYKVCIGLAGFGERVQVRNVHSLRGILRVGHVHVLFHIDVGLHSMSNNVEAKILER